MLVIKPKLAILIYIELYIYNNIKVIILNKLANIIYVLTF